MIHLVRQKSILSRFKALLFSGRVFYCLLVFSFKFGHKKALKERAFDYCVIHTHPVWMYIQNWAYTLVSGNAKKTAQP